MSPLKRKLTFLIVIAAVSACAAGAYAATQSSGASARQAFLNDVAHRLHVTPAQLKKAMAGAFADRLTALVASGRLTKAQANAIRQRLKSSGRVAGFGIFGAGRFGHAFRAGPKAGWYAYPPGVKPGGKPGAWVPGGKLPPGAKLPPGTKLPPDAKVPPGMLAPGPGPRAVPFPIFAGPAFGLLVPGGMKAVVNYLGIRPGQLLAQLRAGKSLAEIAKAHGKSVSGLESTITSAFKTRVNHLLAAKHVTKAQASKILSGFDAQIAGIINLRVRPFPARFRRFHLPGGGRFRLVPHGAAKHHLSALFSSD